MNNIKYNQYVDLAEYFKNVKVQIAAFNLVDEIKVYQAFCDKLSDQAMKDGKRFLKRSKK